MKKLSLPSLLALLLATGCGGGGSDSVENPMNSAGLSDAEIGAVATQLQTAMNATSGAATARPSGLSSALAYNQTMNLGGQTACPLGGRITRSGNATVSGNTDTGAWSINGLVTFHISDPTNNLNDCEVSKGVILDGTLTLTLAGSNTAGGVGVTVTGTMGVNERGPTGGLIPRGDCFVFLKVAAGAQKATGSICGHAVN